MESQGFSTRAVLPAERRPGESAALPRAQSGLVEIARGATVPPLHAVSLALLDAGRRIVGDGDAPPAAVSGLLAAALAALVAGALAGRRAAAWAGVFLAVSPIHTLASREAGPEAPLVFLLLAALALLVRAERTGGGGTAALLGLALRAARVERRRGVRGPWARCYCLAGSCSERTGALQGAVALGVAVVVVGGGAGPRARPLSAGLRRDPDLDPRDHGVGHPCSAPERPSRAWPGSSTTSPSPTRAT